MARRTSRTRQSRSTSSRRAAPAAEVEVVEEAEDGNIDSAIVMLTSVLLLAAILCVDALLGMYDKGLFL